MAKKNDDYSALRAEIASGEIGRCYILHGEERYLLERCVADIRALLVPDGEGGFNHHRYSSAPNLDTLREAIETLPFFAARTLVEISDFDFTAASLETLMPMLRDLPEHVCLLFICGEGFKLDRRLSATKELLKLAKTVEFKLQENEKLIPWIVRHFRELGCKIAPQDAEYLAFVTGGLMSSLRSEIEKIAALCISNYVDVVTRAEIDKHVTPVPDAVTYKLTDAVAAGDYKTAALVLGELIAMREPAHKLIYALTAKMRSLLLARHYVEQGRGTAALMETAGIRYEFQAKTLLAAARRRDTSECEGALRLCTETAFKLNDGSGMESVTELLALLAAGSRR